jgi:hypothetical protein
MIDVLLPAGEGGTLFLKWLLNAGEAYPAAMSIGISVGALSEGSGATEIHERAHLLHASVPDEVNALLRALPRPARGDYANTSGAEHFAEMASGAWQLLALEEGVRIDVAAAMRSAERRVPGTAAMAGYFLRKGLYPPHDSRDELLRITADMTRPYESLWLAVERSIESRRTSDGTFAPWPRGSLREGYERRITLSQTNWLQRSTSFLFWPGRVLLFAMDRVAG